MHQITRLDIDGLGGLCESLDLRNPVAFIGPNDTRKSTRCAAIRIALLGYEPTWGKRPMDTLSRASNGHIRITAHTDAGIIERTFTRKGQACNMAVTFTGSNGRLTGDDAECSILRIFSPDPVFFDLSTVIAASPEKRREFLFGLCALEFDRAELADVLATYHADAPGILSEAWPEEWDSQTGLAAAIEAFKAALSDTKRLVQERDRALQGSMDEVHRCESPPYSAAELETKLKALREQKAELDASIGAQAEVAKENARINARHAVVTEDIESHRDPVVAVGRKRVPLSQATADAAAEVERLKQPVCDVAAVEKDIAELEAKSKALAEQYAAKSLEQKTADEAVKVESIRVSIIETLLDTAAEHPDKCPTCGSAADFGKAIEAARADYPNLVKALEEAEAKGNEITIEIGNMQERADEITSDITFRRSEIADEQKRTVDLDAAEANLANLKAKRTECDVQIVNLTAELQTLIAPIVADLSGPLDKVKADIAQAEAWQRSITRRDALLTAQESHRETRDAAKTKAEAMDAIVKFLQTERAKAVQEASGSLAGDVRAFLQKMDPSLTFDIRFEDERGKPCADMTIAGRPVEQQGTGTFTIAAAAIQAVIMMRKKSPFPVLVIDKTENISNTEEEPRRQQLFDALDAVRDQFANIIVAGTEGAEFPDGWNVIQTANKAVAAA